MEFFKRDKVIEKLLSHLDIPRFNFPYELKMGIGPYDPGFFDKSQTRRKESEMKAHEALKTMTDEELWELSETPGKIGSFALEYSLFDPPPWYAAGFGVSVYKPDYEHWAKMDFWTLEEAACLSIGFKPEKIPKYRGQLQSPYEAVSFFRDRVSLIERAHFNGKLPHDGVAPTAFIRWAVSKELEVPSELLNAIETEKAPSRPAMLNSVDKRQHDTALKIILGLLAAYYGDEQSSVTSEMRNDVSNELAKIGLSLDRKTLTKALKEAVMAKKGFEEDQKERDDRAI